MISNSNSSNKLNSNYQNIFIGDSQMAALMRNYDWSSHPLGSPDNWPLSLKTAIRIMLHSAHPMFIWWSKEFYMFHNDSYVPLIGNKHPAALGARSYDVWAEIWPQMGTVVEGIMKGDKAFYGEELLVPINRKGFIEDAYFTFSYSAMFDDNGAVAGIFCACSEVTETVLAKRRLKTIKDLADSLACLSSLEEAGQIACKEFAGNPHDIPFCLVYLNQESGTEVRLIGKTPGLEQEMAPLQGTISNKGKSLKWPLARVQNSGQPEVFNLAEQGILPKNISPGFPDKAVILPILQPTHEKQDLHKSGNNQLLGFFIAGINPSLEYGTDYQNFYQVLTRQLASSIANIKSRAQVENQKARLERFFMQAPAAICILDGPDLVYELVNAGYQELFPGRELLGKPILEAMPEIANNRVYQTFRDVYKKGIIHEEQELLIPIRRPEDGELEERYFKYIQQPRQDENGTTDGVLVFAYEVTDLVLSRRKVEISEKELKAASDELAAINEELSAANEEIKASNDELSDSNQQLLRINSDLDNFIYTASHDLKAPISNIEGLLQALLRTLPPEYKTDERINKITSMMQSSIDRFRKTISNLTEITKLQKENDQLITTVNFSEVLKDVILDLDPMIQSTNARIETDTDGCSSIQFSEKNLRSIIYNLLSNALKYHSSERTPHVQVWCKQSDYYYILSVKDNGLGIDQPNESKIFTMFKRLHDHVEGAGIGLYMVKKIIDNAGGMIEVESKVGEGSTFKVFFKRLPL